MIETLYAVNFLKGHLQRFINYNRINATIDCGDNYISFYAKDSDGNKQYLARGSNHHLRMQNMADKDEPWKGENISIEFITPKSKQDSKVRATVQQNHYGGIKPFDVTIYQYNNIILDERDLTQIFRALITFLNGSGFIDPFKNTTKKAQVIPRTSNIKPYKEPPKKARNISVDNDGNYVSANAWGADYISESNNIYKYNCNRNMNKKLIRLTESDLHRIVRESVNKVLNEIGDTNRGQYHLGRAAMRRFNMGDYDKAGEIGRYAEKKRVNDPDYDLESSNSTGMRHQNIYMNGGDPQKYYRDVIQRTDDRLR